MSRRDPVDLLKKIEMADDPLERMSFEDELDGTRMSDRRPVLRRLADLGHLSPEERLIWLLTEED